MSIAAGLEKFLKRDQISTDPNDLENFGRDWTRVHSPNASAVIFPHTTDDVQKIVQWARLTKTAIIPSGGRTGLAAGAVATKNEVVISLQRMNKILEFSGVDQVARCQAGVPTEALQDYVKEKNYYFPVDLASRGSSQIGGNLSTNAGGTKVIRYGHMRDWVAGLVVVTGTGEVLKLDRCLVKDNSGYDLKHLFIAAEGTLGIVTEVCLRVTRPLKELSVFLWTSNDLSHSTQILELLRRELSVTAFEFFTDQALDHVLKQQGYAAPFEKRQPYYFLIEFENSAGTQTDLALDLYEKCVAKGWVIDGVMSQSREQAEDFWKYRENISESLAPLKPYKNDISVLISRMPDFVKQTEARIEKEFPELECIWFGHIGDGNLHINVLPKPNTKDFAKQAVALADVLSELLSDFRGSISAEHGIGLLKKNQLSCTRSALELSFMKTIKKAFDPDNIMNPGKIFDL